MNDVTAGSPVKPVYWQRVAILGTGLIGGSFAAALREHGCAGTLVGYGPQAEQALQAGLVDTIAQTVAAAVRGVDLVVLAAPPSVLPGLMLAMAPALSAQTVVTDLASTKLGVIDAAREHLGAHFSRFIAGHPIAGSELSGPQAASATLFRGARCVLCPEPQTDPTALEQIESTWKQIGARPYQMDAAQHDATFAAVSHLPHWVAFALAGALAQRDDADDLLDWAGGGLRDTTRIAASQSTLWADILLENAPALGVAVGQFARELLAMSDALMAGDRAALEAHIERGAQWRRSLRS